MADRYWVGGTAAWDGTAGTKWSATSGGAGGASVPTSADDVFFDANSGANTVTISTGNTGAKSINCTGFTGTLAGTANIFVSGSVTLVAGMTVTYSGTLTLNGTGTLTSAGKTLGSVTINGAGITVTLGDALNIGSNTLNVTQGTFTTSASNYSVTAQNLTSSNSNTRTISLNGSTLTFSQTGLTPSVSFSNNTNLTFNAGTSTIICTGSNTSITGGAVSATGVTFYNVSFTSGAALSPHTITSINTFNNLTITAPSTAGVRQVTFDSRQTINGTLSTTGTTGNRRVWFGGSTYGLAQTLTINSAPSLTDADFRDIYVVGTSAPISGTRIGDLGGCRGITFDTPKTVYWRALSGGTYGWDSSTQWSLTNSGSGSVDNFPLAQDTAVFSGSFGGTTVYINAVALPSIDASGATGTLTFSRTFGSGTLDSNAFYGTAFTLSSAVTLSSTQSLNFAGRGITTITSAGRTMSFGIIINTYGGTVQLADALNLGSQTLTVTNGTFDTKNFNVTAGSLSSTNSNVRTITLGSSTLTLSSSTPIGFITSTNLTFNANTSQITIQTASSDTPIYVQSGVTFYNVTINPVGSSVYNATIRGTNTFNNLTVTSKSGGSVMSVFLSNPQVITGTLTVAGSSPVSRIFVCSDTLGTTRTLTVGTLSATDCDFQDITIAGAAAGSSPTRAGDCGGNSGITFPAPKTVYWNLAGTQNWSATAWCPTSGGTPDINQFPLAQDTAVFDNTGSAGTITFNANYNIGTFNASARTSAVTFTFSTNPSNYFFWYGDWLNGTGITYVNSSTLWAYKATTQTITSNGIAFSYISAWNPNGTVTIADALVVSVELSSSGGSFDASIYNVTAASVYSGVSGTRTIKMGSGTWTLTGTGNIWNLGASGVVNLIFYKGTANIVLSSTSTSARTFTGNNLSYNKLTIGGTTGTSTTTITENNQFTELASTKTVAHTIALGTTTQTFGKWTVTGTAGNVVTLTGTGTSHILAGSCTSGIDYLAMGSIGFAATSPGEFYAGANSTATAAVAPVYLTAKPADGTRYWVGGTGNWSDTARWSTSSGGASGAAVPRSHDDVIFDSASNATAYTATVNAVTGGIRMKSLTIAGPASGNVTLAGSTTINGIHGNVTLPATGLTRSYTGVITLSSNSSGLTFTTNGVTLASEIVVNGVDCAWSLGSALNMGSSTVTVTNGSFNLATYNLTGAAISSSNNNSRTINFNTGTATLSGTSPISFGTTEALRAALTVTASTSQIDCSATSPTFNGNNQTFYNVSFSSANPGTLTIQGANSFNNLSFTGITTVGLKSIALSANQTVTGTLTFSAGTNATMRHFVRSNTFGTTRTITTAAFSGTDVDFRDITVTGAAAPVSGTRLGDCKGNSGITFTAAANKYWNLAAGGNWSANGWALTSGGGVAANNFPLAQDTCIFEATGLNSGATITINQDYNIGTIDMSARTTNTMTLATGTTIPTIYGNWINGTGTTISGTGTLTFAGRGSQTITSAGKTFTQAFTIHTPGGSVTLQDALTLNQNSSTVLTITAGTFDAATYNVTLSGANSGVSSSNSNTRTIAIGSGTWALSGTSSAWSTSTSTNLTVTGTGTISLTSASAKTFAGGDVAYTNITLNQGGNGTLTITGNNTFKTISSTAAGANTINIGTTTQRVTTSWTAAGTVGNVLTVTGTSASSPGTLVFTGSGTAANVDYLTITGVRAYPL